MKVLYLDCFAGLAGDMAVAALCDLADCGEYLQKRLPLLGMDGEFETSFSRVLKNGISANKFTVCEKHGHHHNDHNHDHDHEHHHEHNSFEQIVGMIEHSGLNPDEKGMAVEIFKTVAKAESKVHGVVPEQVHFHEVGAIDSIIDIVALSICIDYIKPDMVCFSKIREGSGFVNCQHGIIPVPAPATLEIIKDTEIAVEFTNIKGEMLTPTGAAIAGTIGDKTGVECPLGKVLGIGYGGGTKDFEHPNIVRAMLVQTDENPDGQICQLCANMDDVTGEQLGFAMEILMESGALDVFCVPVFGKKNRPGHMLCVLCETADRERFEQLILRHTSTIGVRHSIKNRCVMSRETVVKSTKWGDVRIKKSVLGDIVRESPEYEDIKAIAAENKLSIEQVLRGIE